MIFRMLSRERMGRAAKRVLICRLRGHPEMGGKGLAGVSGTNGEQGEGGLPLSLVNGARIPSPQLFVRPPAGPGAEPPPYQGLGSGETLEVTSNGRVADVSHSPVPLLSSALSPPG
jgi:hypothetical protein